jgi:hypothetical protein
MPKGAKFGGRQKGVPNKTTASMRESLKIFLEAQRPEVEKAFKKLSPKEKVFAYTRLLPFVTPQYSSTNFSLKNMTDDDLEFVLQKIKEEVNDQETSID